ncbi:MAG: septum formation initiator family protein [Rhodospirillales bacterium]|nr:septum formation initiator family protein [Rhodospirillales bacterium]
MVSCARTPFFSRRTAAPLIGFALALYFSWPLVQGERSYPRLVALEYKIASVDRKLDVVRTEREALEHKVIRLRPDSIDPDLLEERARVLLGYQYPQDRVVLSDP